MIKIEETFELNKRFLLKLAILVSWGLSNTRAFHNTAKLKISIVCAPNTNSLKQKVKTEFQTFRFDMYLIWRIGIAICWESDRKTMDRLEISNSVSNVKQLSVTLLFSDGSEQNCDTRMTARQARTLIIQSKLFFKKRICRC